MYNIVYRVQYPPSFPSLLVESRIAHDARTNRNNILPYSLNKTMENVEIIGNVYFFFSGNKQVYMFRLVLQYILMLHLEKKIVKFYRARSSKI